MQDRVYVTGLGLINSIGMDVNESFKSITDLEDGIHLLKHIECRYKNNLLCGEVKASNEQLKRQLEINESKAVSRTALLGMIAAKQAMEDAGIDISSPHDLGLVSATSVGAMDNSELFFVDYLQNNRKGKLRNIIHHECGDSTEQIADLLKISQYITTISTACSSSANSIIHGCRLIKNGILERVLVGGADALTKFTINGFASLNILSQEKCKPFDEERSGLNLGEGAGYVVLESEKGIEKSGNTPYCYISGYGNACDAYHQTSSSPDGNGAWLAMNKALTMNSTPPTQIDYVNVHGTGTLINDLSEGIAMERLFENNVPPFSSTKPFTGHTLGASGSIEAILSILSLQHNVIYPNLNFKSAMKKLHIQPETGYRKGLHITNVMSNSFGFGGNNSSLIFSKCK